MVQADCRVVNDTPIAKCRPLRPSEQELHIFWSELIDGDLVVVDGPIDHVRFLLLQQHHA